MNRRAFLTGGVAVAASPAAGHGWYEWECCAGHDCAPVPASAVRSTPLGYAVTLRPGDHPLVTAKPITAVVAYADARPSHDEDFHAYIVAGALKCLYAPRGGV